MIKAIIVLQLSAKNAIPISVTSVKNDISTYLYNLIVDRCTLVVIIVEPDIC